MDQAPPAQPETGLSSRGAQEVGRGTQGRLGGGCDGAKLLPLAPPLHPPATDLVQPSPLLPGLLQKVPNSHVCHQLLVQTLFRKLRADPVTPLQKPCERIHIPHCSVFFVCGILSPDSLARTINICCLRLVCIHSHTSLG